MMMMMIKIHVETVMITKSDYKYIMVLTKGFISITNDKVKNGQDDNQSILMKGKKI